VLNRLDLKIEAGRRLAILGANGSGKTTLLHERHAEAEVRRVLLDGE
jgi:ABC-type molybdenum transport system ATPase subunit/photorepair protein PhrA